MLRLIEAGRARNGYAPTLRELANAEGISLHAIACRIDGLKAKGLVSLIAKSARTLAVTRAGRKFLTREAA